MEDEFWKKLEHERKLEVYNIIKLLLLFSSFLCKNRWMNINYFH